jgi:hypothetical protein
MKDISCSNTYSKMAASMGKSGNVVSCTVFGRDVTNFV